MCLASGSDGNCFYLGTERYGILIDAGISLRRITKCLKEIHVEMSSIRALFVTHDHADHIKGVGAIGEKLHIPVYSTEKVHHGMDHSYCMTKKLTAINIRYIEKEKPVTVEDFHIEAFEVPHDGTDNVGYCIRIDDKVFTFATDLGEITPTVKEYLCRADYLIIEANYDQNMLLTGHYPEHLKQRILSNTGHLCNDTTAEFIAQNYSDKLKYIWLCHLSRDNNDPEKAFETVRKQLLDKGIEVGKNVQLFALQRTVPSSLYIFD